MTWYCIVTNPNCQRRAEAELASKGYWAFWPRMKKWATHARVKTAKEYPLLGRYMFVQIGEGQSFGEVRAINGVESFVAVSGTPVAMPSRWVKDMIVRYFGGEWDYVTQKPVIYRDGRGVERERINKPLPVGARIKLLEGEFANMLATLLNYERRGRIRAVPDGEFRPIITKVHNARAA